MNNPVKFGAFNVLFNGPPMDNEQLTDAFVRAGNYLDYVSDQVNTLSTKSTETLNGMDGIQICQEYAICNLLDTCEFQQQAINILIEKVGELQKAVRKLTPKKKTKKKANISCQ